MREHNDAVNRLDVITDRDQITADYAPGTVEVVSSTTARADAAQARRRLRCVRPRRRLTFLQERAAKGQIVREPSRLLTGRDPITVDYAPGTVQVVEQHDGSRVALRKLDADYDPHDRLGARKPSCKSMPPRARSSPALLYVDPDLEDLHSHLNTVETPLNQLGEKTLCPGNSALEKINASLR